MTFESADDQKSEFIIQVAKKFKDMDGLSSNKTSRLETVIKLRLYKK